MWKAGLHSVGQVPYLEAQNDSPDEAEGQPVVSIHNVMGAHVLKMDSLLLEELKSLVDILQTMDPHPSLSGFRLKNRKQTEDTLSRGQRNYPESHTPVMVVPKHELNFVCIHLLMESERCCRHCKGKGHWSCDLGQSRVKEHWLLDSTKAYKAWWNKTEIPATLEMEAEGS